MVMTYMENGNLRQHLSKDYSKVNLEERIYRLNGIANGLDLIHKKGLIHRDFHVGNILYSPAYWGHSAITDLGLCRPVNEDNKEKIYGVLPYVAPEVIREKKYTQAADIYSWSMVAYEILFGLTPYHEFPCHDSTLFKKINQERLRPNLDNDIQVPKLLKDLITQCWNANPQSRPTASELVEIISNLSNELLSKKDTEFVRQAQEFEEFNKKNLLKFVDISTSLYFHYSRTIYSSRLLDFSNLSKEWQTITLLELQIKAIEAEIKILKEPLDDELAELIENFVEAQKKLIKDGENEEVIKLKEKMREKGLSRKKRDEFIRCCEDLVVLEQQKIEKEQDQLQTNIEVPTKI